MTFRQSNLSTDCCSYSANDVIYRIIALNLSIKKTSRNNLAFRDRPVGISDARSSITQTFIICSIKTARSQFGNFSLNIIIPNFKLFYPWWNIVRKTLPRGQCASQRSQYMPHLLVQSSNQTLQHDAKPIWLRLNFSRNSTPRMLNQCEWSTNIIITNSTTLNGPIARVI